MKVKGIIVRVGYTLLGALLTLCVVLVHDVYIAKEQFTDTVVIEETVEEAAETTSEEAQTYDYEAEADEKLALLQAEAEQKKQEKLTKETVEAEEAKTVSANSIDAAKVKWIEDYPTVNSDKTLEEKAAERSSYEETLAVNAFDKKVIENSTIDFSDVKITILGDSLTEGSNLDEEERAKYAYPVILKDLLGCKEVVNLGIGGSTVSRAGSYAMVDRWQDIPKDSDIIIVFGGSNDCLFENKWDYGELEYEHRMTDGTFCGDLDELVAGIEYVYRDHNLDSFIKLLYINPPSTVLNDAVYAIDPGNMVQQQAFAEAINEIAPAYSFEVIDFYNNNILNSHDRDVNEQFVPDGIRGNAEGYRIMAEHIASQIIQRIEQ
ncbi:MAG: SGNH/GDSL hydrolase family protein [Lachnospiraceae bacterium]|nr:SGNH/GDSL hydrolase family protein [Lachnospiraceae bacterium]